MGGPIQRPRCVLSLTHSERSSVMLRIKRTRTRMLAALTFSIAMPLVFALAQNNQTQRANDFCSQTARALFDACKSEAADNSAKQKAICINISDPQKRRECLDGIDETRDENIATCKEQRDARLAACVSLGEDRYDPTFDPAAFDSDFRHLTNPNPYFPLTPGNKWE